MEDLMNPGVLMGALVIALLAGAGVKLWQQSRERSGGDGGKP